MSFVAGHLRARARARARGQSAVEFAAIVAIIAGALWIPVEGGDSMVVVVRNALHDYWITWRSLTLGA